MKDEEIPHSLIPYPSSLILHPSKQCVVSFQTFNTHRPPRQTKTLIEALSWARCRAMAIGAFRSAVAPIRMAVPCDTTIGRRVRPAVSNARFILSWTP